MADAVRCAFCHAGQAKREREIFASRTLPFLTGPGGGVRQMPHALCGIAEDASPELLAMPDRPQAAFLDDPLTDGKPPAAAQIG